MRAQSDAKDPEGTSAPAVIPTLGPYNYRAGCRHFGADVLIRMVLVCQTAVLLG
jgi:hypothetical protein